MSFSGVMLIAMLALKFIQLISELYIIKPTRHPVHVMPAETPNPPCTIVPWKMELETHLTKSSILSIPHIYPGFFVCETISIMVE